MTARASRTHEIPCNVDLPAELVDEVDAYCERTGMRKKACVELALRRFLRTEVKSDAPRVRT